MFRLIKFIPCAVLSFLLVACTSVNHAQKLDANAIPVRDVAIAVSFGDPAKAIFMSEALKNWYSHDFQTAILNGVPKVFMRNGIPVQSMSVSNGFRPAAIWPKDSVANTNASHLLLLSAGYFYRQGNQPPTVHFDAYLWDVQARRAVWKGTIDPWIYQGHPASRAQSMAAQLLNGMQEVGLIKMKTEQAVDEAGEVIRGWTRTKEERGQ